MAARSSSGTVEMYMRRPYRMVVYREEDGSWAAEFPDLPGLVAADETWEGLLESVEDAKRAWFEVSIEHDDPIPEPSPGDQDYSGKLNLRLPKRLHAEAAHYAEEQGVSLNTVIVTAIARELGSQSPIATRLTE